MLLLKLLIIYFISVSYSASNARQLLMLDAIGKYRKPTVRNIIVFKPQDEGKLIPYLGNLSGPVKLVRAVKQSLNCEYLLGKRNASLCGQEKKHEFPSIVEERLVFVPWYENLPFHVKRSFRWLARFHDRFHFFFSAESHQKALRPFKHTLCGVTSVSALDFNSPTDRFKGCKIRRLVQADEIFNEIDRENAFPRGRNLTVTDSAASRSRRDDRNTSEVVALVDVYQTLNNTLNFVSEVPLTSVIGKRADFALLPIGVTSQFLLEFFVEAFYSPTSACFLSLSSKASDISFSHSWHSLLWLTLGLVFLGSLVVLFLQLSKQLLKSSPFAQTSQTCLFLIATLLGRGPPTPPNTSAHNGSLIVASWMIGTVVLGNFIQTTITAINSIPTAFTHVANVDQINQDLKTGALQLCQNQLWDGIWDLHFEESKRVDIGVIINKTGRSSEDLKGPCLEWASSGKYVVLSVCTEQEVSEASKWNLSKVDDFCMLLRASLMNKFNPLRYKHRRVLLAITEGGFAVWHRKRSPLPGTHKEFKENPPLWLYPAVYLLCSAMSTAALFFELLWHKYESKSVGQATFLGALPSQYRPTKHSEYVLRKSRRKDMQLYRSFSTWQYDRGVEQGSQG